MIGLRHGAAALASLALLLAGCGDATTDEDRIADSVRQFQADFGAGRLAAACSRMTERPAREIGSIGHDTQPTSCSRDLAEMLRQLGQPAISESRWTPREARAPAIGRISVDPQSGTAVVAMRIDGDTFDVRVREQDGTWKLDDFFGAEGLPPKAFR